MSNGLRILKLYVENFKRIKCIEIDPKGNIVPLVGANEQGKTSGLDAIAAVLQWRAVSKNIPQPINHDAESGQVIIDLGDFVVTRKFNKSGTTSLQVITRSGDEVKKAQSFLDGLLGDLSFDPLEFSRQKPEEQREMIARLLKKTANLDISSYEARHARAKERRTEINRDLKRLIAQRGGIAAPTDSDPTKEVDLSELTRRLSDRMAAISQWENIEAQIDRAKQIELELQKRLYEAEAARIYLESLQYKMVEPGSVNDLHEEIENLEKVNRRAREVQNYNALCDSIADLESEAAKCKAEMDLSQIEKEEAIEAADLPIDGLNITEDGVTIHGVPFSQCSGAQRLKMSMAIAMMANPAVRIILVRDGSLLDENNMRIIEEMAIEHDFQVWIECVSNDRNAGIFIEDGRVVN